jgi:hypothetical protein
MKKVDNTKGDSSLRYIFGDKIKSTNKQCCGSGSVGSMYVFGFLDPDPLVRG